MKWSFPPFPLVKMPCRLLPYEGGDGRNMKPRFAVDVDRSIVSRGDVRPASDSFPSWYPLFAWEWSRRCHISLQRSPHASLVDVFHPHPHDRHINPPQRCLPCVSEVCHPANSAGFCFVLTISRGFTVVCLQQRLGFDSLLLGCGWILNFPCWVAVESFSLGFEVFFGFWWIWWGELICGVCCRSLRRGRLTEVTVWHHGSLQGKNFMDTPDASGFASFFPFRVGLYEARFEYSLMFPDGASGILRNHAFFVVWSSLPPTVSFFFGVGVELRTKYSWVESWRCDAD